MAKLSISKASKEWGVSRKTIQDAVKSGQIQVESGSRNSKNVDTSDLLRIFGEPKSGGDIGVIRSDTVEMTTESRFIGFLEAEIKELKEVSKEKYSFLQGIIKKQETKIEDLEEELSEYRNTRSRRLLPWFK